MEQSLLAELIRTLKPKEKAQILLFSAVPAFNNGRMAAAVIPLLDIFLSHPWYLSEQRLEKKQVFGKIFPDQEFVDGKLEKVMVEAHKVVKAFLLAQRYFREENEFHQLLDFSEEARARGLQNRYQQSISRLQKLQKKASANLPGHLHRQFLLEYSRHDEATNRNQGKGDLNIPDTLQALELDYFLNLMVLLNQYLLQQKIAHLEVPENIRLLLIQDQLIPENYLSHSILIRINYEIFNLLKTPFPKAKDVRALFDLLLSQEKNLDEKNLKDFNGYLRNLCILSLDGNREDLEMAFMLHVLYKDNLERGYLHTEGKLGQTKYSAVANNALSIGRFEWALAFMEKYKYEIRNDNETHDIYRLNFANYLFKVGRFSDCLDNIPDTSPILTNLLQIKRLELKTFYELRSDLLPYKLDAFKMFLSRTSQKLLSEAQRQIHTDFANFLHQIVSSIPGNQKRSDLITSRIQEKKQAAEWRWLLEKAKALKDG